MRLLPVALALGALGGPVMAAPAGPSTPTAPSPPATPNSLVGVPAASPGYPKYLPAVRLEGKDNGRSIRVPPGYQIEIVLTCRTADKAQWQWRLSGPLASTYPDLQSGGVHADAPGLMITQGKLPNGQPAPPVPSYLPSFPEFFNFAPLDARAGTKGEWLSLYCLSPDDLFQAYFSPVGPDALSKDVLKRARVWRVYVRFLPTPVPLRGV